MAALRKVAVIFLLAMIVRGFIFSQILNHPEVIFQPDSRMYVSLAEGLSKNGSFAYPETPARPDVERMPGYPVFIAAVMSLFGGYFSVVLFQIVLDSISCVLVYSLAEKISKRAGPISGLLSVFSIGMFTYAQFLLNDCLFLFVFLLILILIFRLLEDPGYKISGVLGAVMGIAVLVRPVIMYLPFFLIPYFIICFLYKLRIPWLSAAGRVLVFGIVFVFFVSPWMARNYFHYGRFKLTAQGGEHFLQYIVPFVWQYSRGIPFIEGMKQVNEAFTERMEREGVEIQKLDPFEKSDLQVEMAMDYLWKEPKGAIIKAWGFGMAKNLLSPAIIDMSYLLDIERPHFFYTEGKTLIERGWNFVKGMKGFFGLALIGSLVVMLAARIIQLWGFFLLYRKKKWDALLCLLFIGYFLLVSGPVGYAKYRLPFEPILIILVAVGLKDLNSRRARKAGSGRSGK